VRVMAAVAALLSAYPVSPATSLSGLNGGIVVSLVSSENEVVLQWIKDSAESKDILGSEYVFVPKVAQTEQSSRSYSIGLQELASVVHGPWIDGYFERRSRRAYGPDWQHRSMLFTGDWIGEGAEGFIDIDITKFGKHRWRAPMVDELKLNVSIAPHGAVRLSRETALEKADEDKRPLQLNKRLLRDARRTPDVPRLNNQDHPLKESGERQGVCGVEEIPTVLRFALCGAGYIGGALLALLGFELSDYKWSRVSASLFGIGALGAAFGMSLLALSAACG
jgi:hypothetical protein